MCVAKPLAGQTEQTWHSLACAVNTESKTVRVWGPLQISTTVCIKTTCRLPYQSSRRGKALNMAKKYDFNKCRGLQDMRKCRLNSWATILYFFL